MNTRSLGLLGTLLALGVAGGAAAQTCPPHAHLTRVGEAGESVACVCNGGYASKDAKGKPMKCSETVAPAAAKKDADKKS